jgi:hypothetical protein
VKGRLPVWLDSDNLGKTTIYLFLAIFFISISLVTGPVNIFLFTVGSTFLLYAFLRPWGKVSYFFVLFVVSIILLLLLVFVGINILIKMHNGKMAEDIGCTIGGFCIGGFIAGIIGMLRYRKFD